MMHNRFAARVAPAIVFGLGLLAAGSGAALAAEMPKAVKACKACHSFEAGKNKLGPSLFGIVGTTPGTAEGFTKYSKAMIAYGEAGNVWDAETLDAFLEKPRSAVKGTKMAYPGQKKPEKRTAIIEYLSSLTAE